MTLNALRLMLATTAITGSVIAVVLLRMYDPNQPGNPFPGCIFYAMTELYCAGCGLTRAAHAIVHGDFAKAFSMNALAIISAPVLGLIILKQLQWLPTVMSRHLAPFQTPWFWVGGVVAFWIARNLPWQPFSWLAPG